MESSDGDEHPEHPERRASDDPEFYRRVLHHIPAPILVVNEAGEITYANQALIDLGGWDLSTDPLPKILDYVHPEDQTALANAFLEILQNPAARQLGGDRPWAEIYVRLVTADGTTMPIEVVGSGGILDDTVGGILYNVRPALARDLFGRILDGLSQGASVHHLLTLVCESIASPPLDLQAVILQSTPDASFMVAASSSQALSDIVRTERSHSPWDAPVTDPSLVDVATLGGELGTQLRAAGYADLWHVAVESPMTATTLRIVAVSPTHHVPSAGQHNRMIRSRELAAVVLLRTQPDGMKVLAAGRDPLTDLPNRQTFYQLAESLDPAVERGAIHLDLDGLKRINSELGSATGDAVLQIVADRLRVTCRPDDLIGRIGDDEFTILLVPARDGTPVMERCLSLAGNLLTAIRDTVIVAGRPLKMSTSIGVAVAASGVSTEHLLTWADAALHDAKRGGGGRICRYGITYG